MFTKSIRWRLQLWLAFLLAALLTGFGLTVYQLHRVSQFNQIDDDLSRRLSVLSRAVREPPRGHDFWRPRHDGGPHEPNFDDQADHRSLGPGPPDGPPPDGPEQMHSGPREGLREMTREFQPTAEVASLFDGSRSNGFYYAVWFREQSGPKVSTNAPNGLSRPMRVAGDTAAHLRTRGEFREAYHFTEKADCVLAGRSIRVDLDALRSFALILLAAGGGVLAVGFSGGWWLTTRAIRPIETISVAASRISAGNLSERIDPVEPENEIGRLAGVLNSAFARLEAAFAQQKQFTADASHELRTPLAVLISEAQTTLARERTSAEYRESIAACLDTAQQMKRLAESLLELARLDSGQDSPQRARVDLAEVARACVERLLPLTQERGLKVQCELAPAETFGNADQLAQVVTNLVTNAIHYNRRDGEIRVSTRIENDAAILIVGDTGIGIAPADLPHVFERFFRADKSRARAAGRTGLGLAISKAIVESHGGSIEVTSQPEVGSTFIVRLTATPPSLPASTP
jgi:two-component system OmpR family sensor kinase